ncbi:MAG: YlbF family regulator [Acholeplasmatales bacterium]|jgi:cell fate (sporulation/competence/biofilm development) regulator YmcA (YheA/YmcA/DUF963 family)|nr:YlbF family regulator [Acholeplasmatales bacterium]
MDKCLEDLLEELKNNSYVIRYKELTNIISKNKYYKNKISNLKHLQQTLVKSNNSNDEIKLKYDTVLAQILEDPITSEYLEIQNILNELVKNIMLLVTNNINID